MTSRVRGRLYRTVGLLLGSTLGFLLPVAPSHGEDDPAAWVSGSLHFAGQAISDPAFTEEGEGDRANFVLELKVKKGWGDNFIFVHLWGGEGDGVYAGSSDPSLNMGAGEIELVAAQLTRNITDFLAVTVGKIDPSAYFDANALANDGTSQFMASAFVNNPTIMFPMHEFGFLGEAKGGDMFTFMLGVFEDVMPVDQMDGDEMGNEVRGEFANKFVIGEVGLHYDIFLEDGNLRLTGWNSGSADAGGFSLSWDQEMGEYFGMFSRIGSTPNAFDQDTAFAFSLGGQFNFGEGHRAALAYSTEQPGDSDSYDNISWVETYLSFALDETVALSGHLQFVVNPENDATNDALAIYGFRVHAVF